MIETVGLGIAMGNAPTDVKSCANAVTDSNEQNGVKSSYKVICVSRIISIDI